MRKTLEPLEGKLVVFTGWETSMRHEKAWVCVSRATVKAWDRNTAVEDPKNEKDALKLDHFWLTGDNRRTPAQPIRLYNKIGGIGVVRKYQRMNGSWDYTVKSPENRLCIEEFVDLYNDGFDRWSQKEKLAAIHDALEHVKLHEQGNEIVFGMAHSVDKFKKDLLDQELEMSRSVAATDKALETATMNGKCKGLNLISYTRQKTLRPKGF